MDLRQVIRELLLEKELLDRVIAELEGMQNGDGRTTGKKRRGRKSMALDERREVSERMAKYWASRREGGPAGTTSGRLPESGARPTQRAGG